MIAKSTLKTFFQQIKSEKTRGRAGVSMKYRKLNY